MRTVCITTKLKMPFGNIHIHVEKRHTDGRAVGVGLSAQGKADPEVKDMLDSIAEAISESLGGVG